MKPVAYLIECKKKPSASRLSFNPRMTVKEANSGFVVIPLAAITEVDKVLHSALHTLPKQPT